jgi:peptide/nickel transport system ATP-binding protein
MRQRVMIAMAFSCNPSLIIADEATTALDVTVQAQILALIRDSARKRSVSVLMISHDLAVVGNTCDRVYVMYQGEIVEQGLTAKVLGDPDHAYTRALLNALPGRHPPRTRLATIAAQMHGHTCASRTQVPAQALPADAADLPVLDVRHLQVRYAVRKAGIAQKPEYFTAVDDVSISVSAGETVSLVGESGCGKSSFLSAVIGLTQCLGEIRSSGTLLPASASRAASGIQMVFQDPLSSLNPRWPIWRVITEPVSAVRRVGRGLRRDLAAQLCEQVDLSPDALNRLPHEFSGGQRQRIAIARALSLQPRVILLDEPTSALDVSVQAQILNLLLDLQDSTGLAYLFVSHDLAVVRHLSDRIAVMEQGRIVETGSAREVLHHPQHPYTRKLLAAMPELPAFH